MLNIFGGKECKSLLGDFAWKWWHITIWYIAKRKKVCSRRMQLCTVCKLEITANWLTAVVLDKLKIENAHL